MISKQMTMKSARKSNFAGLVTYITNGQNKNERVGEVTVTNCHSDQPEVAMLEVLNTQAQNTRALSDKTYHLLVSFRPNEQPDATILKTIEARICDALGYSEHQRVSAVHYDTDNMHLHLAINKIHPTSYRIHDQYNDYKIRNQLCEKLEHELGLDQDNHNAQKCGAENRAADMEHHSGIESLIGWIKRECFDQIQSASSWKELHQVMRENGLKLHERGNGLAITAEEGTTIKASSIGREYSKNRLEARFGLFEPSFENQSQPVRKYQKKPMRSRINTEELYARYKKEQLEVNAVRTAKCAKALERKKQQIESAKKSSRQKRTAAKLIMKAGLDKRIMSAAINKSVKNDIENINTRYQKERQQIYDKYKRQAWADWLRTKATGGDRDALEALRAREEARRLKGNTVAGESDPKAIYFKPRQDSITKKGTIIYCVGDTVLRDAGDRLKVSRGADQDGLRVALRMAVERYGNNIHVNGSAVFKEQIAQTAAAAKLFITFDDAALEGRRQELLLQTTVKERKYDGKAPPVDKATAERLQRLTPGPAVSVSTQDTLKKKGLRR